MNSVDSVDQGPQEKNEVQSQEVHSLQLVVAGHPAEAPHWVAPFITPQLRQFLSVAFPL
jgi:hypothetical protein